MKRLNFFKPYQFILTLMIRPYFVQRFYFQNILLDGAEGRYITQVFCLFSLHKILVVICKIYFVSSSHRFNINLCTMFYNLIIVILSKLNPVNMVIYHFSKNFRSNFNKKCLQIAGFYENICVIEFELSRRGLRGIRGLKGQTNQNKNKLAKQDFRNEYEWQKATALICLPYKFNRIRPSRKWIQLFSKKV